MIWIQLLETLSFRLVLPNSIGAWNGLTAFSPNRHQITADGHDALPPAT